MTYRIFANDDDTAAAVEYTSLDLDRSHVRLKFAVQAAMLACAEYSSAVYADLCDEPVNIMFRTDVVSDTVTATVRLIELESNTVTLSFRIVDVDANDANDES